MSISITFIGNATTLISVGELTLGGTRLPAGPRLPGLTVIMDGRQGAEVVEMLKSPQPSRISPTK